MKTGLRNNDKRMERKSMKNIKEKHLMDSKSP